MFYPARLHTTLHTTTPEGENDDIEYECRAMISLRDDQTWAASYTDKDNKGRTSLQGTPQWMSITREGDTQSRLRFRVGEKKESLYRTSMGELALSTLATHYRHSVDEHSGRIELHYNLLMNDSLASQNRLLITWERL